MSVTTGELLARLALAGVLGALIGLERELRAKEAGLRTHFLVTLGSALLMIVSQTGFQSLTGAEGTRPADAARIAAQIVSGIGFLGAGTIIMQKQSVRGLTTAAGLWVAAGIGMAVGGGLYVIGAVTTAMTLVGLELFQVLRRIKIRHLELIFTTKKRNNLVAVTSVLKDRGYSIVNSKVSSQMIEDVEVFRVTMDLLVSLNSEKKHLMAAMRQFNDVEVEKME